nr:hypothetical protein [uncultured bacterium]
MLHNNSWPVLQSLRYSHYHLLCISFELDHYCPMPFAKTVNL